VNVNIQSDSFGVALPSNVCHSAQRSGELGEKNSFCLEIPPPPPPQTHPHQVPLATPLCHSPDPAFEHLINPNLTLQAVCGGCSPQQGRQGVRAGLPVLRSHHVLAASVHRTGRMGTGPAGEPTSPGSLHGELVPPFHPAEN